MAHVKKRQLSDIFRKHLTFSPIVGVFGHRQVGKSTFISGEVPEYRTLDDIDQLEAAGRNPKDFIRTLRKGPLAIDECQLAPKLFPTLKEWVRTHKSPGQYVLSGSVRFTSRKAIRESLAGRLSTLEMFPFSVSEILSKPLSDAVVQLFYHQKFSQDSIRCLNPFPQLRPLAKQLEHYLEHGGLPGLCFIRNPELRRNSLNDLHDLILARDLRLISELKTPFATIKRWMSILAKQAFEPYNAAEMRRLLGLAPQTQKSLLFAMESIFLIRRIPIPLRKKEIILLEDQYEEWIYAGPSLEKIRRLEGAVYRNVRTQFGYRLDKSAQFESYLTRDYARVPLVIKNNDQTLGIIVTLTEKPTLAETRSASSFLRHHSSAKLLYLSAEIIEPRVMDDRSLLASIVSVI